VNVDALAETIVAPEVRRRLRCSRCGGKRCLPESNVAMT
jgi:hypothetical protein